MAVHLSPANALGFSRPFQEPVKRTLIVSNRTNEPIAFKVKTTAPKAYCVRPNSGRIEPDEGVEIQVILQAMKEDPPPATKCKDKFLVQSMSITPDMRNATLSEMWGMADRNPSNHEVHQQRVKVVFLPSDGGRIEEHEDQNMDSTFMSVNDSRYDTVRQFPLSNGTGETHLHPDDNTALEPQIQMHQEDVFDRGASPVPDFHAAHEVPIPNTGIEEAFARAPPAPLHPIHSQPPTTQTSTLDDLSALQLKYAEAQQEITQLRALLASAPDPSSGLRRRNVASTVGDETLTEGGVDGEVEKETTSLKVQHEEYFSPQVVAIIALLVFTLTYLFF